MSPDRVSAADHVGRRPIATARVRGGRFNPFGSGALDLLVLSEADELDTRAKLCACRLPHRGCTGRATIGARDEHGRAGDHQRGEHS